MGDKMTVFPADCIPISEWATSRGFRRDTCAREPGGVTCHQLATQITSCVLAECLTYFS